MDYQIIKATKGQDGVITHVTKTERDSPAEHRYLTIRGGLSWPNQEAPGYYVILGQVHGGISRFRTERQQKKPLRILAEFESKDLSEFLGELTRDTAVILCQGFYTDQSELWQGYEKSLSDYCKENQIRVTPYIDAAPFVDNFQYGANLIKAWLQDRALSVPQGTVLYSQLANGGVKESDFDDINITVRFYAINALRHAINAFAYHDFKPLTPMRSGRRRDGRVS